MVVGMVVVVMPATTATPAPSIPSSSIPPSSASTTSSPPILKGIVRPIRVLVVVVIVMILLEAGFHGAVHPHPRLYRPGSPSKHLLLPISVTATTTTATITASSTSSSSTKVSPHTPPKIRNGLPSTIQPRPANHKIRFVQHRRRRNGPRKLNALVRQHRGFHKHAANRGIVIDRFHPTTARRIDALLQRDLFRGGWRTQRSRKPFPPRGIPEIAFHILQHDILHHVGKRIIFRGE
mmetsp:Transcript_335/g.349  ORF Transcript_335/g.349 Transcript_335/m.349 type:complete len:236 (+) Transcript_335:600-1307(+)